MKIGILTYHRTHNYGAFLQAIATRELMATLGHEACFIDYWPEYHQEIYTMINRPLMRRLPLLGKLGQIKSLALSFWPRYKRIKVFRGVLAEMIAPHCRPYGDNEEYDAVLYGSDQIWRKQMNHDGRFNPVYFADNKVKSGKHLAWAASMGKETLSAGDWDFLTDRLHRFDAISVRESTLCEALQSHGIPCSVISDPTLMLSSSQWDRLLPAAQRRIVKEPYALYYPLMKGIDEKQMRQYAKANGLRLITLRGSAISYPRRNVLTHATPSEMVSLIKHADVVFTSSFHGLVFSILYKKNVIAGFEKNADRAKSLLSFLRLEECMPQPGEQYPTHISTDYTHVEERITQLQAKTREFIERNL